MSVLVNYCWICYYCWKYCYLLKTFVIVELLFLTCPSPKQFLLGGGSTLVICSEHFLFWKKNTIHCHSYFHTHTRTFVTIIPSCLISNYGRTTDKHTNWRIRRLKPVPLSRKRNGQLSHNHLLRPVPYELDKKRHQCQPPGRRNLKKNPRWSFLKAEKSMKNTFKGIGSFLFSN